MFAWREEIRLQSKRRLRDRQRQNTNRILNHGGLTPSRSPLPHFWPLKELFTGGTHLTGNGESVARKRHCKCYQKCQLSALLCPKWHLPSPEIFGITAVQATRHCFPQALAADSTPVGGIADSLLISRRRENCVSDSAAEETLPGRPFMC